MVLNLYPNVGGDFKCQVDIQVGTNGKYYTVSQDCIKSVLMETFIYFIIVFAFA